jgi:hypothetical protein
MSEAYWIAALLAGLAGGVHCAGMCGGIVCALATGAPRRFGMFSVAYHTGRIASYSVAGALAGALGTSILPADQASKLHAIAFALASLTLVLLGLYVSGHGAFLRRIESIGATLWRRIEPFSRSLIPVTSIPQALGLGALWGWLPCGLVYGAAAIAATTGSAAAGMGVMVAFGAGTLPSLLGLGYAARAGVRRPVRPWLRRSAGFAVMALGFYGFARVAAASVLAGEICHTSL